MSLETLLNLPPCEINGYALTITRYHNADKDADMWEVAYIGDKGKCLVCKSAITLEEAVINILQYLINVERNDNEWHVI